MQYRCSQTDSKSSICTLSFRISLVAAAARNLKSYSGKTFHNVLYSAILYNTKFLIICSTASSHSLHATYCQIYNLCACNLVSIAVIINNTIKAAPTQSASWIQSVTVSVIPIVLQSLLSFSPSVPLSLARPI